jgi:hydrogenase/urease accessory protein HupE
MSRCSAPPSTTPSQDEVARQFGEDFAEALLDLEPGAWRRSGPVALRPSPGEGHRAAAGAAAGAGRGSRRGAAEWRDQRRREAKEQAYRRLRERYEIVMEPAAPESGGGPRRGVRCGSPTGPDRPMARERPRADEPRRAAMAPAGTTRGAPAMKLLLRRLASPRLRWFWLLAAGAWPRPGLAHESQPGLLELRQLTTERLGGHLAGADLLRQAAPGAARAARGWQPVASRRCSGCRAASCTGRWSGRPGTLDGSTIAFPGLEQTITDVFVRVSRLDGSEASQVVRPTKPRAVLRGERPWTVTAGEYLVLGFHHILLGVDHLLFVLGLLIIVRGTAAAGRDHHRLHRRPQHHAGAGDARLREHPGPPLNAAIALSILFLGPEIVRVWRGQTSFTIRHPWVVAFGFGLLHGFGFASGLSTVGMPRAEIPLALLMFNVGVELGQLAFVALILLCIGRNCAGAGVPLAALGRARRRPT